MDNSFMLWNKFQDYQVRFILTDHGLLRAWNSVDLCPVKKGSIAVNPKAAISGLHQVRIPNPHKT